MIRDTHASVDIPWALIGDFNAITSDCERWSSVSQGTPRGAREFADIIDDCELIDLGFIGPSFTWQRRPLKERLDRGLANLKWSLRFPDAHVTHLNPLKSDQPPLLLSLEVVPGLNRHRRPFPMLATWMTHPGFHELVKQAWDPH